MKEGITMANRNGMGPMNQGALTGRGLGNCATGNNMGIGAGFGMAQGSRRGLGRGIGNRRANLGARGFFQASPLSDEEALKQYKDELKQELASVEEELTNNNNE